MPLLVYFLALLRLFFFNWEGGSQLHTTEYVGALWIHTMQLYFSFCSSSSFWPILFHLLYVGSYRASLLSCRVFSWLHDRSSVRSKALLLGVLFCIFQYCISAVLLHSPSIIRAFCRCYCDARTRGELGTTLRLMLCKTERCFSFWKCF